MLKLINYCNDEYSFNKFNNDYDIMRKFFKEKNIDGIELIQNSQWKEKDVPREIIKGLHMRFYPMWLDFWREDKKEVLRQFKDLKIVKDFYGGTSRQCIIDYYKKEIQTACDIGVKYVVFHVSHVQMEHCFSYEFTYSDEEIVEAAIELLNEIFKETNASFKLLLENLWWPGLTFKNKELAEKLMKEVNYDNKGFILDTSHLMNTNLYLKNEEEAVKYMIDVINNLGEMKKYIKGIHLNSSLSGEYVRKTIEQYNENMEKFYSDDFYEMFKNVYNHIFNIDKHRPFLNSKIRNVVDLINPEVIVYEFSTNSLEELNNAVSLQNEALKL